MEQLLKSGILNYIKVNSDQKYFLKVKINKFDADAIEDVKKQLVEMNHPALNNNINTIINCLKFYYNREEKTILSRLDSYWFDFHHLPLLEIQNTNAKITRHGDFPNNDFGYVCHIDRFEN